MQLFEKCMDTALKIPCFIKKRRSPTPWRPLLKCLKNCFCIKNRFEPFSRGLQGVGDLLFFIKHGIFRAVSMHFSNNCMHSPYIVQLVKIFFEKLRVLLIQSLCFLLMTKFRCMFGPPVPNFYMGALVCDICTIPIKR